MQRPISVTILGILNIVFGVMGVVCTPFSLLMTFAPSSFGPLAQNAQAEQMVGFNIMTDTTYRAYMLVSSGLGFVVAAALLAAGIGLLKLKPWARTTSIVYAIYSIIAGIGGYIFSYFYIIRPMMEQLAQAQEPGMSAARFGAAGGTSIGLCAGLAYPIVLLIFMFLPDVKRAFYPAPEAPVGLYSPPPLSGDGTNRLNE